MQRNNMNNTAGAIIVPKNAHTLRKNVRRAFIFIVISP